MRIQNSIKVFAAICAFVMSFSSFANSGVYGGGPIYQNDHYSINELRNSGFSHLIVWTIHIESDGSLGFNGEFPLVANGSYIGGNTHADFIANLNQLKAAGSSITRLEFGLSGYGSGTFDNVKNLINCSDAHCGTGPNSILYRNFKALKDTFPMVDALNNDDEDTYDVASAVQFHIMLADIGFKAAIVPYTQKSFWSSLVSQVNQARPGAIDLLYLQVYAGGASNNPCSWNIGLPVYPGLWSQYDTPQQVQNHMQSWKNSCSQTVKGGFMWLYDDFDNSAQVQQYASAINAVFDTTTPTPDQTITARASIHSGENQDKAFDGSNATKWLDNAGVPTTSNPSWIKIHYNDAKTINKLSLTSANDEPNRDPQDVQLQASNDNNNWVTLGSWSDIQFSSRFQTMSYSFNNAQSYSYFRLNTTKNRGNISKTQIAEIELSYEDSPLPTIVDHTNAQGVQVTARASIHSGENAPKAIDNDTQTKWLDNGGTPTTGNPSWLQISLPSAKAVSTLAITSANDASSRDPQDFMLQGSNDASNWTTIASFSNESWSSRFQRRTFDVSSSSLYSNYRLATTGNQGNVSMTQLAEIELLGPQ